ncbi:MAG: DNA polymerase III subunit gamma/tau [Ilumatobacteraceae bacterium]
MATQALYRRYRPRRFGEVKGQEHVVRALRNAVIHGREGQAYLFSGPRGTGKTTSARILAKVLNCSNPIDGEPCCECESCLAVERGTSYDVHELDAASNNGVDAMRDLIEKSSLGTPGRHKVYILDEVHMLSKAAEAALLKTLEEPPPHVVFVLATTDPQKVSETIRSRTQHLQFHLLPMDVMESHIRWLATDAGIALGEDALQSVLRQGGGSARDTVSALELVAAGGGEALDITPLDEFIEAFIESDPGRALTVVASAMQQGRDARGLTDDIVRHLRDCFLSLMAPELVQLPVQRAAEVAALASRLGAASAVRAMERLGEMLVEMRHAPDPRLLLEVALVQLTHPVASNDISVLLDRVARLEQQAASGPPASARPAPVDPTTGRAALGGRARTPTAAPTPALASVSNASTTDQVAAQHPSMDVPQASVLEHAVKVWATEVMPALKSLPRAIYAATRVVGVRDGMVAVAAPNEAHRLKCEQHRAVVEAAVLKVVGAPIKLALTVEIVRDGGNDAAGDTPGNDMPANEASGTAATSDASGNDNVVQMRRPTSPPPDEEVDLDGLVDAPPETVVSPVDRLAQAFPGSQIIDE